MHVLENIRLGWKRQIDESYIKYFSLEKVIFIESAEVWTIVEAKLNDHVDLT